MPICRGLYPMNRLDLCAFQSLTRNNRALGIMAQRVQRHGLLDPGRICRLVKQAAQLAGSDRLAAPIARKQPAFRHGCCSIVTRSACLPPLAEEIERLWRQHDIAVLAAFRLLDPDDLLRAVDMLDLQPDHFAGAQAAAIAETEQRADLETAGDGKQAPRLVRAHHQRDLLRLTDVIDLVRQIQSPQGHAEQEPQPGHDCRCSRRLRPSTTGSGGYPRSWPCRGSDGETRQTACSCERGPPADPLRASPPSYPRSCAYSTA